MKLPQEEERKTLRCFERGGQTIFYLERGTSVAESERKQGRELRNHWGKRESRCE